MSGLNCPGLRVSFLTFLPTNIELMYFCPPQLPSLLDSSGVYIICVDSAGYFNGAHSNALVLRWASSFWIAVGFIFKSS